MKARVLGLWLLVAVLAVSCCPAPTEIPVATTQPTRAPVDEAPAPTSTAVAVPTAGAPTAGAPTALPPTATPLPTAPPPSPTPLPTVNPEEAVLLRAEEAVRALSSRDLAALATLVHPVEGVRFSPYAFVQETDQRFTPDQLPGLLADPTVRVWGAFDGSGRPIELTFAAYYERFVYDQDFANPEQKSLNQRLGQGNSLDNSREFYPGSMVVEYHFSGFDPQYAGLDWRSLRLIFQELGGAWYLVGVIHDEWTI
jgi:hypothetical protein